MRRNSGMWESALVYGTRDCPFTEEFLIVDLETSGLDPARDEILAIGAVIVRNGEILRRFHTFVQAEQPLRPWISRLTGITEGMLQEAPDCASGLEALLEFGDGRPMAVHCGEFTLSFLWAGCQRFGMELEPACVDIGEVAKALFPEMKSRRLKQIARQLGLPAPERNEPLESAGICAGVLARLFGELEKRGIDSMQGIRAYERGIRNEG